ncbi:hypothetical protein PMAYCL1PPCAC_00890, partial [Pristionchus mayeri]
PGSRTCRVCSNHHGLIRKYDLAMGRCCFLPCQRWDSPSLVLSPPRFRHVSSLHSYTSSLDVSLPSVVLFSLPSSLPRGTLATSVPPSRQQFSSVFSCYCRCCFRFRFPSLEYINHSCEGGTCGDCAWFICLQLF